MPNPSRRPRRQTPARAQAVTAPRPGPPAALYLRGFPRDVADRLNVEATRRRSTIAAIVTDAAPAVLAELRSPYAAPPLVTFHLRGIPENLADELRIEAARRKVRIADLLAPPLRAWLDARARRPRGR